MASKNTLWINKGKWRNAMKLTATGRTGAMHSIHTHAHAHTERWRCSDDIFKWIIRTLPLATNRTRRPTILCHRLNIHREHSCSCSICSALCCDSIVYIISKTDYANSIRCLLICCRGLSPCLTKTMFVNNETQNGRWWHFACAIIDIAARVDGCHHVAESSVELFGWFLDR